MNKKRPTGWRNGWQTWTPDPRNLRLSPSPDTNTETRPSTNYVLKESCDQFSDLLDADGNLAGHPDGDITGRRDGFTVFSPESLKGEEVCLVR